MDKSWVYLPRMKMPVQHKIQQILHKILLMNMKVLQIIGRILYVNYWIGSMEMVILLVKGRVASTYPSSKVHHMPVGIDCWKIWVDVPHKGNISLFCTTSEFETSDDAIGSIVAWPKNHIKLDL